MLRMETRPGLMVVAAVLMAGSVGQVLAADPGPPQLDSARLAADSVDSSAQVPAASVQTPPATQPASESSWPPGLMMEGLDAIGLGKPMKDLGLRAYGFVETGMTFRIRGPGAQRDGLYLRGFDARRVNNLRLNQLEFTLDRPVDTSKTFDLGGRFDFMYGTDAKLTHSLGLLDKQRDDVQPDITQGYSEMWLKTGPDGQGLDIMFGKWFTPIGSEVTYPMYNYLYSHSLVYIFAQPITHTGLKLTYSFDSTNSAYLGIVRGWDVFKDNNDGATFLSGFTLSSKDQVGGNPKSQLLGNVSVGPEQAGDGWPGNRFLLDLIWNYRWTEKLTQVINFDYGWQNNVPDALGEDNVPGTRDSGWLGLAYTANYAFNQYVSATGRFDWLTDAHGVRTGYRGTFFSATTGLTITPFPKNSLLNSLQFRPEFRTDWSSNNAPFASDCQMTAAFDVIYKF
jgi:hypothetical protein